LRPARDVDAGAFVGPLARVEPGDGRGHRIALRGRFGLATAGVIWADLRRQVVVLGRGDRLDLDLRGVEAIDGGTMALLVQLRSDLAGRGVAVELTGARARVQELVHLYEGDIEPTPRRARKAEGFLAQVGRSTLEVVYEAKAVLDFLGMVARASVGLAREPRTGNWRHVLPTMERTGVDAIPIVVLINFLVGFVVAYQAAAQLRPLGAEIYVADLVGLSITREMAPLMTAIIVCGRSGAAFAAELGSMKVSEEIDALRTMGFGPVRYLVLPRMVALVLVMPVLTLIGDFVGIMGGFLVASHSLDITLTAYITEMQTVVFLWDIVSGLVKSMVFGGAICLIACQQGFATTGGAEGVGRRTTSAVVSILFSLIVIDAAFTVFFEAYGL